MIMYMCSLSLLSPTFLLPCIPIYLLPASLLSSSLSLSLRLSLKATLGSVWVNDINVLRPLVSVGMFAGLITDQLGKYSKGVKTGSHKHRLLFSSQKAYNKVRMLRLVINGPFYDCFEQELEEAFPWLNLENGDEKETQPTDTPTTDVTSPSRIEEWYVNSHTL